MSGPMPTPVSRLDDLLREAFALRASSGSPAGLRELVLADMAATGQRRAVLVRLFDPVASPSGRLALAAAVAALLLVTVMLALAAGARRPQPLLEAPPGADGRLAYVSGGDLYVADPDGGRPRLLWDASEAQSCGGGLAWAGAHTLLVANPQAVYAVDVASGERRVIGPGQPVAVSRDGRLVLTGDGPDGPYRMVDVATGAVRWETDGFVNAGATLSWSPDGRWFVAGTADAVVRVDAASGRMTTVVDGLGTQAPHDPVLTPDGGKVIYVDYREGCLQGCGTIWSVPLAGGLPTRLTPLEGSEVVPVASPDGRWIAYFIDAGQPDEPDFDLMVMRSDGTDARPFGQLNEGWNGWVPQVAWDANSSGFVVGRAHVDDSVSTWMPPGDPELFHVDVASGAVSRLGEAAVQEFAREVMP